MMGGDVQGVVFTTCFLAGAELVTLRYQGKRSMISNHIMMLLANKVPCCWHWSSKYATFYFSNHIMGLPGIKERVASFE